MTKLIKLLLALGCGVLLHSTANAQAHLVIKDDAYIVLNTTGASAITDSVFVVMDNGDPAAVSTSGTGGNLITKYERNYLKWNIGTNAGTYNVPFTAAATATNASMDKIPLSLSITAGTGAGNIKFSSYTDNDATNNYFLTDYMPSGVTNVDRNTDDIDTITVNRFWIIDANGYTTKPTPTIDFGYDDQEVTAGNTITDDFLVVHRWNASASDWFDIDPGGTVDPANNVVTGATVANTDFESAWILVGLICPHIVITNPDTVCAPSTIDIIDRALYVGSSDTLATTWRYWSNAAATIGVANPTAITTSGTYYITNTSASGCTDTASIIVEIDPTPSLSITQPTAVCEPNTIDLTAAAVTAGSSLEGGTLSYLDSTKTPITNIAAAFVDSAKYYIVVNTTHCTDTAQVNAIVNPKPSLVITDPDTACAPLGVDLTVNSVTDGSILEGASLSYYTNAGATNVYNTPTSALTGTYYIVAATAQNCFDTAAVNVMVESVDISVDATDPTQCGSSTGVVVISGIDPNTDYTLSYNTVIDSTVTANTSGEIIMSNLLAGNYVGIRVATTTHGCANDALPSVILTDPGAPFVDAGDAQDLCDGMQATLTAITNGNSTIAWDNGITDGTPFTQSVGSMLYTVTVDSNSCLSTDTVTVNINSVASGTIATIVDCSIDQLDIEAIESTSDDSFYQWLSSTDGVNYNAINEPQSFSGLVEDVWYIAEFTNASGCVGTDTVVIAVCTQSPIKAASGLTVDGNGENDTFWIENIWLYPANELTIYNRWGSKVYHTFGYNNEWDGTRNGSPLPVAAYFYILELNDEEGTVIQGTINLLRP